MGEERYWCHMNSSIIDYFHKTLTECEGSKKPEIIKTHKDNIDGCIEVVDKSYIASKKSKIKKEHLNAKQKKCCEPFPRGKKRTILSILFALIGLIFTFLTRSTTAFVNLNHAISFGSIFDDINHLGLIEMDLCSNDNNQTKLEVSHLGSEVNTRCSRVRIDSYIEQDTLWILPTISIKWVMFISPIFFAILLLTTFAARISITPLFIGLLITYFCQVATLLVLGSTICKTYSCSNAQGMNYSIISSVGWFLSCIFVIMMSTGKCQVVETDETIQGETSDEENNKSKK